MTATTQRPTATLDAGWASDERPPDTARARLVVSAASLAALAVGLAGLLFGAGDLRALGLLGYLLFGLGAAPWALSRRMGLALRLTLSAAGSLTALILAATVMLLGDLWYPTVLAVAAIASTAVLHVAGVIGARRDLPARTGTPRPAGRPAILLAAGGAALCAVAALTHRHLDPGLWGFLARIGPLWYLGLLLVIMSLAVARSADEVALAVGVVLLTLILTGTPALVYDGPRSQSAAKHLEFVQQIRDLHHLRTTVPVYNGWPGFFAAIAWVADVAGLRDPIGLATAWPVVMGLGQVTAMRYLAGQLIGGKTLPWVAVGLGVLADPVGQDYFSPQSAGFVLGLAIFGLALSALRPGLRITAMVAAGSALTVAHQLSPYVVGGTLCVLVLFRRVRPWWTPATVLAPALTWTLLHWSALGHFFSLADLGSAGNFRPPAQPTTPGLHRLPLVPATLAALVGGVLLLGLVALVTLVRGRRDRHTWAVALGPATGLVVVAINPYGNEGIFRAILFALPWLAVLAARALRRDDAQPAHWRLAALLLALTVTFDVSAFGLDATNVLRPPDRAALLAFMASPVDPNATNYLLVLGPGDLPDSPPALDGRHVVIRRAEIDPAGFALTGAPAATTARQLTDRLAAFAAAHSSGGELYAFWSPVSSNYGWEYGMHTRAQFAALRDAFAVSPSWRTVYAEGGTVLFAYRPVGS